MGRLRTIESIYDDFLKRREGLINALTDGKSSHTTGCLGQSYISSFQLQVALGFVKNDGYCFKIILQTQTIFTRPAIQTETISACMVSIHIQRTHACPVLFSRLEVELI
jgi:hypothetical protein